MAREGKRNKTLLLKGFCAPGLVRALYKDDSMHSSASHFQNRRRPRDVKELVELGFEPELKQ